MGTSKTHFLYLDGIRALAAIYVVLHHAAIHYYDPTVKSLAQYNLAGLKLIFIKLLYQGHFAVNLFIVVSGFSLMLSIIKNGYVVKGGNKMFYKRRIIRIIPTYYFAILFSLLCIWLFIGSKTGTHWDVSLPVTFIDVLKHVFLIHDFWGPTGAHINHVFWSIVVECRIYIFFPVLVCFWREKGPLYVVFLSILISVIGVGMLIVLKYYNKDISLDSPGVSPYIILFTFGMLAADLSQPTSKRQIINVNSFRKVILLAVVVCVTLYLMRGFVRHTDLTYKSLIDSQLMDMFTGAIFALILFALGTVQNFQGKFKLLADILSWRPLAFIGTFSYSLYLIHAPILQVISQYLLHPLHYDTFTETFLLIIIGTPVSVMISYGFFLTFELPFMNMGRNKSMVAQQAIIHPAP